MVYDRTFGDRELNFEPSGALWQASLVMRDRETDSWWSIMTSEAIGGELDGADLRELPMGEKATWGDWVSRHPETLVLSVDGKEHDPVNNYDDYHGSGATFRGLEVDDARLPPKEPIFSFHHGGRPMAAPHAAFKGGRLFPLADLPGKHLLLYRDEGATMFASTRAYLVDDEMIAQSSDPKRLLDLVDNGASGAQPVEGFDTFWYNWIAVNEGSELLR